MYVNILRQSHLQGMQILIICAHLIHWRSTKYMFSYISFGRQTELNKTFKVNFENIYSHLLDKTYLTGNQAQQKN